MFMRINSVLRNCLILIICNMPLTTFADESRYSVSLLKLIVDPGAYEGKRISVKGYLGALALFPTEHHARIYDHSSSLAVIDPSTQEKSFLEHCGERYVDIEGRLMRNSTGRKIRDSEGAVPALNDAAFYWIEQLERVIVYDKEHVTICWPVNQT